MVRKLWCPPLQLLVKPSSRRCHRLRQRVELSRPIDPLDDLVWLIHVILFWLLEPSNKSQDSPTDLERRLLIVDQRNISQLMDQCAKLRLFVLQPEGLFFVLDGGVDPGDGDIVDPEV